MKIKIFGCFHFNILHVCQYIPLSIFSQTPQSLPVAQFGTSWAGCWRFW
uniref:Uncharacterized protein n=1 Tax=Anguilla anguilla TaxID=7936 RepID=A0A0E9RNK4_ANGAN